jgi:hypothetical protein
VPAVVRGIASLAPRHGDGLSRRDRPRVVFVDGTRGCDAYRGGGGLLLASGTRGAGAEPAEQQRAEDLADEEAGDQVEERDEPQEAGPGQHLPHPEGGARELARQRHRRD